MRNLSLIALGFFLCFPPQSFGSDAFFTTLDDQSFSVKPPAVLNFWATWCAPCIKELPDLEELGQKLGNDATVYLINFGENSEKIKAFMKKKSELFGENTIIIKDATMSALQAFGLKGVPTTILINYDGNITEKIQGLKKWGFDEVVSNIKEQILK